MKHFDEAINIVRGSLSSSSNKQDETTNSSEDWIEKLNNSIQKPIVPLLDTTKPV